MTFLTPTKLDPRWSRVLLSALIVLLAVTGAALALVGPPPSQWPIGLSDTTSHIVAFALFALLAALARPRSMWIIAPLGMLYGGLIELAQPFFERSADWTDVRANAIGIGLGLATGLVLYSVRVRILSMPAGSRLSGAKVTEAATASACVGIPVERQAGTSCDDRHSASAAKKPTT